MGEKKKELSQKEKRTLMIVSLAIILALVFGISYAYFLAQDTSAEQQITTQNIGLILDDGTEDDTVTVEMAKNIKPILRENISTKAAKKNFTITNNGDEKMFVHITLEDMTLPPALKRYDFMWSLFEVIDGVEKNVSNGSFANATDSVAIGEYLVFDAPVTTEESPVYDEKEYNLYIWIEETGLNQNTMMGQEFKATIVATGEVYHTSPEEDFVVEDGLAVGWDNDTSTSIIKNNALSNFSGTYTDIIIPSTVNGKEINYIAGMDAFKNSSTGEGKNIKSVIIPNTVTEIGSATFYNNQLSSIVIPNSVTKIGVNAFYNNILSSVVIPNSVTEIGNSAFYNNQLSNIVIPNGITSIGTSAFSNNQLTTVIIPSSVTTIGTGAFSNNSTLTQIIVQGKSEAPEGFANGWNGSCTNIKYNSY